ncbi:MAG: hypothetical protein LBI71_01430 [Enterobacteriaceae bacterium]|jgi:hypothetical protein|nr:hypothetical protein [Enterobacteriaceae bacterium]
MQWIIDGLFDLRCFIEKNRVRSIAIPSLEAGNGGLNWDDPYLMVFTIGQPEINGLNANLSYLICLNWSWR